MLLVELTYLAEFLITIGIIVFCVWAVRKFIRRNAARRLAQAERQRMLDPDYPGQTFDEMLRWHETHKPTKDS